MPVLHPSCRAWRAGRPAAARALVLLGLALSAAACSATRIYEGPPLQEDQVARIRRYPDGVFDLVGSAGDALCFQPVWHTRIVGVDDVGDLDERDGLGNGNVEVLAGRHCVRATLKSREGARWIRHPAYVAVFEAFAGHEYQLRGRGSALTGVVGFDVWDVDQRLIVGSSDVGPQECVTAKLDWGGRRWTQADWGRVAARTSTSFVPSGEVLSRSRELVELQYLPAWEPLDLDAVVAAEVEELEGAGAEAYELPVESGPELRVFTWQVYGNGEGVRQGVTCARNGPQGCHLLTYATRDVFEPEDAAAWAARFKAAELLPPAF